jgi:short-subunit dehydrogenase
VGRDEDRTRAIAAELGELTLATPLIADLAAPEGVEQVERRIADEGPAIDLLVNCAGYAASGPFVDRDVKVDLDLVSVNVLALVRLTRAAAQAMVPAGRGAILNVSSTAGFRPAAGNATYAASKAFVNSFSQAMAAELGPSGVIVTCVCPGYTRTRFLERANLDGSSVPEDMWQDADDVAVAALAALVGGHRLAVTTEWARSLVEQAGIRTNETVVLLPAAKH